MQNYFLGGNTNHGFCSLYDGFCAGKDDFLYVIKGGPGCGKSSFMKRIAQNWEEGGLSAERVFCSGDPDSLDGIYCPELHFGYVDGTAPHRQDVRYMGLSGAYLDFSPFFRLDELKSKKTEIEPLADACSQEYKKAYRALTKFTMPHGSFDKRPACFLRALTCCGLISFYPADTQSVSEKELQLLLSAPCRPIAHPLLCGYIEGVTLQNTNATAFYRDARAEELLAAAVSEVCPFLAAAKALHDALEALYKPFVDFQMVDDMVKRHVLMQKNIDR